MGCWLRSGRLGKNSTLNPGAGLGDSEEDGELLLEHSGFEILLGHSSTLSEKQLDVCSPSRLGLGGR